jgi:hypothetical protein
VACVIRFPSRCGVDFSGVRKMRPMPIKAFAVELAGLLVYGIVAGWASIIMVVGYYESQAVEVVTTADAIIQKQIFEDAILRSWCLAGAGLGAALSVAISKLESNDVWAAVQSVSRKISASALTGVIGTPLVFRYVGWDLNVDNVFVISSFTALLGVQILEMVIPLFQQHLVDRFKTWLGGKKE